MFRKYEKITVLRIRDVFSDPGSDFFPSRIRTFSIPDPDPESASKNLSIFNPQKWFLSFRKYDPGCSFRIPDPDPDPDLLPIPDSGSRGQGSKKAPDPGSGSATLEKKLKIFSCIKYS